MQPYPQNQGPSTYTGFPGQPPPYEAGPYNRPAGKSTCCLLASVVMHDAYASVRGTMATYYPLLCLQASWPEAWHKALQPIQVPTLVAASSPLCHKALLPSFEAIECSCSAYFVHACSICWQNLKKEVRECKVGTTQTQPDYIIHTYTHTLKTETQAAICCCAGCCGGEVGASISGDSAASVPLLEAAPDAYGINAGLLLSPSSLNMARSALRSLFGVVSSLSPSKMLLAPAMKHNACSQATQVLPRPQQGAAASCFILSQGATSR